MKYLVLDCGSVMHRAYHAHSTKDEDTPSLAIHTTIQSINKFYQKFNPNKIVLAFDRSSWRKDYTKSDECVSQKPYKGHRLSKMTQSEKELYYEFIDKSKDFETVMRDVTTAITLSGEKLEADDLIALFIQMHEDDDNEFIVVSSDNDLLQLFRYKNVSIYDPKTGKQKSLKEYDDDPEYFLFEKCIRGDRQDNIQSAYPGVRKTVIKEAYTNPFAKTNMMHHTWPMPGGEKEFKVGDLFKENKYLMDLECQPEDLKKLMIKTIMRNSRPVKFSFFRFMQYCGVNGLDSIADNAQRYVEMLSL